MKKSIFKKIVLLFAVLLFAKCNVFSQCTPVFEDGFETGSYTPTWTIGTSITSAVVNTVSPAIGVYKLSAFGGNSTHLNGLSTTFAAATPSVISWYIYPTGNQATSYFVAGDNAVTATNCLVFSYWDGATGNIRFVNSANNVPYPATQNTWYRIDLKNINYTAKTSDIYVNGVLFQTAFAFRSTSLVNVSRLHLYNYNNATGYWDHIVIGSFNAAVPTTAVDCFGNCTGSASIALTGGTAPFSYTWSTGSTASTVNALCAGIYTVVVTDGNCTATSTLLITSPAMLTASVAVSNISCNGGNNGSGTIMASGGTSPFTYTWMPAGGTSATATNLSTGTYTILVKDASNCIISNSVAITQPSAITATSSQTNITCVSSSGQAQFAVSGGTSPYTYSWAPNSSTTTLASGLSAGNYSFTVTDANSCVQINTVGITNSTTAPNVTVSSANTIICAGQSTTLTANGASTYSWNTSGTTASIIISPTVTTTYTVTGTNNSNGCSASAVITQSVINCTTGLINTGGVPVMAELYPNPTSGTFNISINENANLIIYDILGKTVLSKEIEQGNNAINLNNQPGGVYFIEIKTSNTKSTFKLIKN